MGTFFSFFSFFAFFSDFGVSEAGSSSTTSSAFLFFVDSPFGVATASRDGLYAGALN
jgi:hypothetical protein